jgi:hypothetical protein
MRLTSLDASATAADAWSWPTLIWSWSSCTTTFTKKSKNEVYLRDKDQITKNAQKIINFLSLLTQNHFLLWPPCRCRTLLLRSTHWSCKFWFSIVSDLTIRSKYCTDLRCSSFHFSVIFS